jgi:hypothetical protein
MSKKHIPLLKRGKHKKHDLIVNDFENQKQKHIEKLTNKMLNTDEKNKKLKSKIIKGDIFKNFK